MGGSTPGAASGVARHAEMIRLGRSGAEARYQPLIGTTLAQLENGTAMQQDLFGFDPAREWDYENGF